MPAHDEDSPLPALDSVVQRFGRGPYEAEIVRAREEFTERTGRFFEEDELYEARTSAFLEWYAIERPLGAAAPAAEVGRPPVRVALATAVGAEAAALRAWATSHRSLFTIDVLGAGPDRRCVELTDLLGGGRFSVHERRTLHGVNVGDIVEARLAGWRDEVRFGRTFLFHAAEAHDAILEQVRRVRAAGGTRLAAVDHVALLRMRAERYRHVSAARVYETGPVPRVQSSDQ